MSPARGACRAGSARRCARARVIPALRGIGVKMPAHTHDALRPAIETSRKTSGRAFAIEFVEKLAVAGMLRQSRLLGQ